MAPKIDNNERLDKLRRRFGLARYELATIMQVTKSAVDRWLRPRGNPHRTDMPGSYLRLLELEIGTATPEFIDYAKNDGNGRPGPK